MALPAIFDTPQLLGALEVGVLIAIFLFGVMTMQGHFYLTHCKNDSWILVSFVCFVLVLETLHTVAVFYSAWSSTIGVPDIQEITKPYFPIAAANICAILVTISVQTYYFYRIRQLSSKAWISILGWIVSVGSFGFGLFLSYQGFTLSTIDWLLGKWSIITCFGCSAVIDVVITGLMCFYLRRISAPVGHDEVRPMRSSTELINASMLWAVETGMLTSITNIAVLICLLTIVDFNLIWMALCLPLGKLYSNSLLANLNARVSRRNTLGRVQMYSGGGLLPSHTQRISLPASLIMSSERMGLTNPTHNAGAESLTSTSTVGLNFCSSGSSTAT